MDGQNDPFQFVLALLYTPKAQRIKKHFQRQFATIKPLFIVTDRQAMDKTVAGTHQTGSEVAVRQRPYK